MNNKKNRQDTNTNSEKKTSRQDLSILKSEIYLDALDMNINNTQISPSKGFKFV